VNVLAGLPRKEKQRKAPKSPRESVTSSQRLLRSRKLRETSAPGTQSAVDVVVGAAITVGGGPQLTD